MEEINQNQTTQEQVQAQQSQPKSPFPRFILITVVLLVIGLIGGAYYLGVKKDEPKACTLEAKQCSDGSYVSRTGPNCEFSPCPTSSSKGTNDTSNWKTYTNSTYGFSFKYPLDWEDSTIETYSLREKDKDTRVIIGNSKGTSMNLLINENINVDTKKPFTNLEETIDKFHGEWKKRTLENRDSIESEFYHFKTVAPYREKKIHFFSSDKSDLFIITLYSQDGSNEFDNQFDQILSTFKFLSSSSIGFENKSLNWSKKTINLYGLELDFPSGWTIQEINRRPEPTDPYNPRIGHDCANYVIKDEDNFARIDLLPFCGFSSGGVDKIPSNAITIKYLEESKFLFRYLDIAKNLYRYAQGGESTISEVGRGTYTEKTSSGHLFFQRGNELIVMTVEFKYSGQKGNENQYFQIVDKIIESIKVK